MPSRKPNPAKPKLSVRERVLLAAEHLLAKGSAEFSMRELAAEAGVSFATPFNQFGSKSAIMHALSARLIETMHERYATSPPAVGAPARILHALEIAAQVMLDRPGANRAIMAGLGAPSPEPGDVWNASRALWATALDDCKGLEPDSIDLACITLPAQLAFSFRGLLSFWAAGEISDDNLVPHARGIGAASLMGFVDKAQRKSLIGDMVTST